MDALIGKLRRSPTLSDAYEPGDDHRKNGRHFADDEDNVQSIGSRRTDRIDIDQHH